MLRSIVEIFLRNAPEQAAEVSEAVRRGDAEATGKAAHKLKGGAATVGAYCGGGGVAGAHGGGALGGHRLRGGAAARARSGDGGPPEALERELAEI